METEEKNRESISKNRVGIRGSISKNGEAITVPRAIRHVYSVHDEYMTPEYLVTCLEPYIKAFMNSWEFSADEQLTVYCPFDTEDSEYVRYFKKFGAKVIFGDLKTGQNFFDVPIPECDLIISNPPFSRKKEMFEKLFRNGTPFCMLMNLTAVQYQEIGNMFYEESLRSEPVQFLILIKKCRSTEIRARSALRIIAGNSLQELNTYILNITTAAGIILQLIFLQNKEKRNNGRY